MKKIRGGFDKSSYFLNGKLICMNSKRLYKSTKVFPMDLKMSHDFRMFLSDRDLTRLCIHHNKWDLIYVLQPQNVGFYNMNDWDTPEVVYLQL